MSTDAKDAARYRWARQQQPDRLLELYLDIPGDPRPKHWDAMIDAAMARDAEAELLK